MIRDSPELAGMYFAATSSAGTYRMRRPDGEFVAFSAAGGGLVSDEGWTGKFDGDLVRISKSQGSEGKDIELTFRRGALSRVSSGGIGDDVEFSSPIVYEGQAPAKLWCFQQSNDRGGEVWLGGDRLRLWYKSPNQLGAVLVPFVLVALWCCIRPRVGLAWRILCGLAMCCGLGMLFLTKSRGSAIALAFGVAVLLVFAGGEAMRRWRRWCKVICLLVFLLVAGLVAYRSVCNANVKSSDSHRIELLGGGLKMLRDGPGGWGTPAKVGWAYSMWYAPIRRNVSGMQKNLVNEHFTSIVALGWVKGALYLFIWIFPLFIMLYFASSGGSSLPAAIWTALNTACMFNVILGVWSVWLIPIASLRFLVVDRRWLSSSTLRRSFLAAFAAVFGLIAILFMATWFVPQNGLRVRLDGGALIVGNGDPKHVLVDDGQVIGGISMPLDVRRAYSRRPDLPPLKIFFETASPKDVAGCDLTLAGDAGEKFISCFENSPDVPPPRSVTFLSPPFPPSKVPSRLLSESRVRYVIGEFASRYFKEMTDPPDWCIVVPGAEMYIPGWAECCF